MSETNNLLVYNDVNIINNNNVIIMFMYYTYMDINFFIYFDSKSNGYNNLGTVLVDYFI